MFHKSTTNKFLFDLVKEKPVYIYASLIISLTRAILNAVFSALSIAVLIAFLSNNKNTVIVLDEPRIIKYFFNFLSWFDGRYQLVITIALLIITIILKNLVDYVSVIIDIQHKKNLVSHIKMQSIFLLCKVNINYYHKNSIENILSKLNREIDRTALAIRNAQNILTISITIFTFAILLILISWQLTLVATLVLSLMTLTNHFFVSRAKKLNISLSQQSKLYSQKIIDFLTGIRLIKTVANEAEEFQAITQLIRDKEQVQFNNQAISAIINPINEVFVMMMILVLIITSHYLYNQQIQEFAPILLIYLVILFRLLPFISQFNNARTQFFNTISSAEIIADFLNEANQQILKSGNIAFSKLQSGIQFAAVTFAYPNHAKLVLDKIDIWIPQGKTTALVGNSGSGKSTIVNLLSRFYDPIDGSISIDELNLQEYDLKSLRKAMSVISQDTFLFNNSVAYNIAYGLKNVSETDIINAAKKANAYEFISQLPQGLATEIGDRGFVLSPGQRQGIAIARAFLRDPDILILDEATSGLDRASEQLVQQAIEELCHNRTTLIIAHQLSAIKNAHQIIVLNQGKIIEVGTHEELLQNGNFYSRWYSMQFKTSQQSHQQKLAQKISRKLAHQTSSNLSYEIRTNLNSLLNYLQLVNEGLVKDAPEQEKILDESYQSAKNILASLREYERQISRGLNNNNP